MALNKSDESYTEAEEDRALQFLKMNFPGGELIDEVK